MQIEFLTENKDFYGKNYLIEEIFVKLSMICFDSDLCFRKLIYFNLLKYLEKLNRMFKSLIWIFALDPDKNFRSIVTDHI